MNSADESTKVVFYQSERGFRNARTIVALIAAIAIAGFATSAVIRDHLNHTPSNSMALYIACFFTFIVIVGAKNILTNTRDLVELSRDGMHSRGSNYNWNSIVKIGKTRHSFSKNVWIRVETQTSAGGSRGFVMLYGKQPLTPSQFSAIAQSLKQFTSVHYPFVKIED